MVRKHDVTWTDEELVQECLDGHETAWTALVEKYKRLVYGVAMRYRLAPEDAAEVFQGVWADLYRDLGKLERAGGLRSWLITAASRRSMRCKRKRRDLAGADGAELEKLAVEEDPASIHEAAERQQALREAIRRLSPRNRKMVEMLFFTQPPAPYETVARELGLAVGSIGFVRGRCLRKLRGILDEMGVR